MSGWGSWGKPGEGEMYRQRQGIFGGIDRAEFPEGGANHTA